MISMITQMMIWLKGTALGSYCPPINYLPLIYVNRQNYLAMYSLAPSHNKNLNSKKKKSEHTLYLKSSSVFDFFYKTEVLVLNPFPSLTGRQHLRKTQSCNFIIISPKLYSQDMINYVGATNFQIYFSAKQRYIDQIDLQHKGQIDPERGKECIQSCSPSIFLFCRNMAIASHLNHVIT